MRKDTKIFSEFQIIKKVMMTGQWMTSELIISKLSLNSKIRVSNVLSVIFRETENLERTRSSRIYFKNKRKFNGKWAYRLKQTVINPQLKLDL